MFSSTFASFEEESSSFSSESNERFFEAIPPKGDAAVVADAEPKGFVPKGCALKAANGCCPIGNGSFDGVGNLMFDDVPNINGVLDPDPGGFKFKNALPLLDDSKVFGCAPKVAVDSFGSDDNDFPKPVLMVPSEDEGFPKVGAVFPEPNIINGLAVGLIPKTDFGAGADATLLVEASWAFASSIFGSGSAGIFAVLVTSDSFLSSMALLIFESPAVTSVLGCSVLLPTVFVSSLSMGFGGALDLRGAGGNGASALDGTGGNGASVLEGTCGSFVAGAGRLAGGEAICCTKALFFLSNFSRRLPSFAIGAVGVGFVAGATFFVANVVDLSLARAFAVVVCFIVTAAGPFASSLCALPCLVFAWVALDDAGVADSVAGF